MSRTIACAVLLVSALCSAAEIVGIARIPDPPPSVDGSLDRLGTSPTSFSWDRKECVVYGPEKWDGPADLSGQVFLGWDLNKLYISAVVVDDTIAQPYFGRNIYKGDHLELFLDIPRKDLGARNGKTIQQIGISPGNFAAGDAYVGPELVRWSPALGAIPNAVVASARTEDGYRIEAAVPWDALDIEKPREGIQLGLDVTLSDADTILESGQETMASLLTSPWTLRDPNRMLEAALGDASGQVAPEKLVSTIKMTVKGLRVPSGTSVDVDVSADSARPIKEVVVRARIDHEKIAGGTQCLQVELNGTVLGPDSVRNRLKRFPMIGRQINAHARTGWFIFYSPDFQPPPAGSTYAVKGIHPYELRFDVSDLWKTEGNQLRLHHSQPKVKRPIIADVGLSENLSPKLEPPRPKVAPTGPISTFEPVSPKKPEFSHRIESEGVITVRINGHEWRVQSTFSTVEPGWVQLGGENGLTVVTPEYRIKREVIREPYRLHIIDRITNTSNEDQPVMIRHSVDMGEDLKKVYIAGYETPNLGYRAEEGAHPVSLGLAEDAGLALISECDLMRAQSVNLRNGTTIGIRNNRLVVAKNTTAALEFSIYPLETPDYFLLINRVRDDWGVNFTIDGSFAFMKWRKPFTTMSDEQLKACLVGKSAKFICSSMGYYKGVWAHGTAFKYTDPTKENVLFEKARELVQDIKTYFYHHCYISVHEDDRRTYADDALRRPDGSQADYRDPIYPIFLPREGSAFAKVQDELFDMRYDKLDLDGIYWDEIAYSAYKYDYSDRWDRCTAVIDPETHRITKKIANVTLATLSWREKTAKRLLARGGLIGNGAPLTRTFSRLHFPRFIETGSISNLTRGQLYTPIALGDHLTERTPVDCYRNMLDGLNYGAVYYWYSDQIVATEPTFTSVMFPMTPIELGPGYIIGKERILTNRSGLFGWGDQSSFEVAVFDENGKRTDKVKVPVVKKAGKTYAEVRIPEGLGVALIRKP